MPFAGLAEVESFRPDVVLLDLRLTGINGLVVAEALRQRTHFAHLHHVALTGWGTDADRHRTRQAGFAIEFALP